MNALSRSAADPKRTAQLPTTEVNVNDLQNLWAPQIHSIQLLFPDLRRLDQNIGRLDFMHDAFDRMESDPIYNQLALMTLINPYAARDFFGDDQGFARVFFIEYLASVDRKQPDSQLIPLAIRLLKPRKNMQKGQDEDIEELFYYYLSHRQDDLLINPVAILKTLDINAGNWSVFARAFGPIMAKLSDSKKTEVVQFLRSKKVFPPSPSGEKGDSIE